MREPNEKLRCSRVPGTSYTLAHMNERKRRGKKTNPQEDNRGSRENIDPAARLRTARPSRSRAGPAVVVELPNGFLGHAQRLPENRSLVQSVSYFLSRLHMLGQQLTMIFAVFGVLNL